MQSSTTVQAVSNALKIMEILSETSESGVSDLARALECQKSTTFRLLNTLKNEGYIVQDEKTEKYSLSLKIFRIGSSAINNLDLNKAALPIITQLSRETAETIHLCSVDNNQIVYLQKIESTYALKVTMLSRIGATSPFYCTGVGKVLLAYQQKDIIKEYLEHTEFQPFTEHTITNPGDLDTELERIRRAGMAYDNEEHELGVRCIAAPIFNQAGMVIAALSVSGPTVRLVDSKLAALETLVIHAAHEISTLMGYAKKAPCALPSPGH
jgi:IclR family KDG regulon transcriptional repressor